MSSSSSAGAPVCEGIATGTGDGLGVAVGRGVGVGAGVAVGSGVADGTGVGVAVGRGVGVGAGVAVGSGVADGTGVAVGVSGGSGVPAAGESSPHADSRAAAIRHERLISAVMRISTGNPARAGKANSRACLRRLLPDYAPVKERPT